jgi:DNA-binding beta-propeller fold protein YncE
MQHRVLALLITFCLVLTSCRKDPSPAPIPTSAERVFVVCEGLYGSGNSALTLCPRDSGEIVLDAFHVANGQFLGDVFQSMMATTQNQYLLCINNSDRIIAVDKLGLTTMGSINVPKPRYIVQVSPTKAYVSTLYSPKVFIINPATLTVTGDITLPSKSPEGMLLHGDKVYVATWDTASTFIYAIDTATNTVSNPITVAGRAPQEIIEDKEGMLWVLSGNKASGVESKLTRLNPSNGSILKSYSFGTSDPVRLVPNPAKDSIYFIEVDYNGSTTNNGVYRMGIHDAALPAEAFIPTNGLQYFWALGIHPRTGHIYVADPRGFTQRGSVSVFRQDGGLVRTFGTAVGPGHFYFE